MAKKKAAKPTAKRDATAWTKPRQFRLSDDTLAEIDAIAAHYGVSRSDAVRFAIRNESTRLSLNPKKNPR